MWIPLTKYGWPQVAVLPALIAAAMLLCLLMYPATVPGWFIISAEAVLAIALIWVLTFFRDPYRIVPQDKDIQLAPADGKITDIEIVNEDKFIAGPALRIGIFLSIFDVHINRAPCNVSVEKIRYKKGRFKNAANPLSGQVNESNDLYLVRTDRPNDKLILRQISGAIARRIVCQVQQGQKLTGGEKFGMIKFGSRTELYVPADENLKCLAKVGDKVKAGLTPLVRYE